MSSTLIRAIDSYRDQPAHPIADVTVDPLATSRIYIDLTRDDGDYTIEELPLEDEVPREDEAPPEDPVPPEDHPLVPLATIISTMLEPIAVMTITQPPEFQFINGIEDLEAFLDGLPTG